MKILFLADKESKSLWDYFDKSKLEGIDLIVSCGDLSPKYLSFLATFTHAPILYVRGNHDVKYAVTPPEGCINIDGRLYQFQGIRILGLGGSMEYGPSPNQYSEKAMQKRIRRLMPQLLLHRGFDILVTHAPAYRLNDGDDLPHRGFSCFIDLMDRFRPAYFVHGHLHANYGDRFQRESRYRNTFVINAYESYILELDPEKIRDKSFVHENLCYYRR